MKPATLDLETDPFEHGKMIYPFLSGYFDGKRTVEFWGPDCIERTVEALEKEPEPLTIYAHNGGRFDWFYFLPYIRGDMRVINGRIVEATMGKHTIRDSFSIMPFPLAKAGGKGKIDYAKLRVENREKHREEIETYWRQDLTSLFTLVAEFLKTFGDKLTIGSTAMAEIKKRHKFECGGAEYDANFRAPFFYGGRNQVFRAGVISGGTIRVYDVNSMYPFCMSSFLHPIGTSNTLDNRITRNTVFVVARGKNYGAFPTRLKNGGLDFTISHGDFSVTRHEFDAAEETGSFKCVKILKTYGWKELGTFDKFVDDFYSARAQAKLRKDKIYELFYKYVLNSGYGKFAQNPERYKDFKILHVSERPEGEGWTPHMVTGSAMDWILWERPSVETGRHLGGWYNIAIGASITGAARAHLLRGLRGTQNPLYCDTDSIICDGDARLDMDAVRLGAWKLESTGDVAAIAGKKLYAIFDRENEVVKKAHKGAKLTGEEIRRIAQGETIESPNPVPAFKLDGSYQFVSRKIRRTA